MSNKGGKRKGKPKSAPRKDFGKIDPHAVRMIGQQVAEGGDDAEAKAASEHAAQRVTEVMQKMSKPYEPVLVQLKRMGIEPRAMDVTIADEPVPCFVIPCEDLIRKEMAYIAEGGILNPNQPVDPVVSDVIKKFQERAKNGAGQANSKVGRPGNVPRATVDRSERGERAFRDVVERHTRPARHDSGGSEGVQR